ncbi:MAG: tRNA 4-thiouridine(8) synthase ThiI, partial [Actinobacteria bacterium]
MFERVVVVHYHELGLKGRNRSVFERRLQSNLDAALVGLPVKRIERAASRLVVPVMDEAAADTVASRCAQVAGVNSASPAYKTAQDMDEMQRAALLALQEIDGPATFKVDAKRSNTEFATGSLDVNVAIGEFLRIESGLTVRLKSPDATVRLEIVQGAAYVYSRRFEGPGGLPTGTAGTVVSLLSAGLDSPVASWKIARRGAVVV